MIAPFQPGDVVVCVATGGEYDFVAPVPFVSLRGVYRIGRCGRCRDIWAVQLVGDPNMAAYPRAGYPAFYFRKIDAEVTEDFRQQLRSLKSPKPTLNPKRHSRERVG